MVDTVMSATATRPSIDQIWSWLGEIPDPEIPVISITDLGIVRDVTWDDHVSDTCIVTVTPTYSGCPATEVIAHQIREQLAAHGIHQLQLRTQLSPPWTTDWLSETGRASLSSYGIAPPAVGAGHATPPLLSLVQIEAAATVACPHCGSTRTQTISQFGSTPCKSLHRCLACMEPFDHFKAH